MKRNLLVKHAEKFSQLLLWFSFALLLHAADHHNQELIKINCAAACEYTWYDIIKTEYLNIVCFGI